MQNFDFLICPVLYLISFCFSSSSLTHCGRGFELSQKEKNWASCPRDSRAQVN